MSETAPQTRTWELRLREQEAQIAALTRRIFRLEQQLGAGSLPSAEVPTVPLAPPFHEQTPVERATVERATVERATVEETLDAPPLNAQPLNAQPLNAQPLNGPPLPETPPAGPHPASLPAPEADWEGRLGTNWLHRAGILLIVIGVVLFLGYAMTELGAAGRIAIASGAGLLMLAAGYWFDGRGHFRPWSLGIIGGGFAVLYATAFAAHAVDAARVIHNQSAGVALQTLIAVAAITQAVRFASERAAAVAFLAAFVGILSSDASEVRFAGSLPLTLAGIWLAVRMNWEGLPWGILLYSWLVAFATASSLGERQYFGQPVSWLYLALFASYEIWQRTRQQKAWHPLWLVLNLGAFLLCTFDVAKYNDDQHHKSVLGWLTLAGTLTSALRFALGVRREALSEALTVFAAALWIGARLGPSDPLLAMLLVLAVAMLALFWNRRAPTLALTVSAELLLGIAALILMAEFPDSKVVGGAPLDLRLALPHMLVLMACLFTAGRLLTGYPWPSWLALIVLAEATLWTVPKTVGTILLALEAIAAVAAGLYLQRRPIRLGGLALFVFSILKVFFYDLAELSTLPRILSFIVLGALLLGASWGYTRYRQELQKYW